MCLYMPKNHIIEKKSMRFGFKYYRFALFSFWRHKNMFIISNSFFSGGSYVRESY